MERRQFLQSLGTVTVASLTTVPPSQAEVMVEALKEKGVPVAFVLFAGEQHGFRQSENIRRALDGEFWFYAHIFGFEPADDVEPIEVWNDA